MERARVLIADDHAFVLHGLVNLLTDRFDVVAAVADGQQLVDAATRLRPDLYGSGDDKDVFHVYDAVDLYSALASHTSMTARVTSEVS